MNEIKSIPLHLLPEQEEIKEGDDIVIGTPEGVKKSKFPSATLKNKLDKTKKTKAKAAKDEDYVYLVSDDNEDVERILVKDLNKHDYIEWEQSSPAFVWTVKHGLGRNPSVTVLDTAGNEVMGAVKYTSDSVVISFNFPFSGKVILR